MQSAKRVPGSRVTRTRSWPVWLTVAALHWPVAGCGSADGDYAQGGADEGPGGGRAGGAAGAHTGGSGAGADEPGSGGSGLPMETEEDREFETPQAGLRFVFVANTARDSVALIDSTNLTIRTVAVGDAPIRLATVPGQDTALVINVGTRDLSVVRATVTSQEVTTLGMVAGANRISVAPRGGHAIVWYDAALDDGRSGQGSFQDVTLVRLAPGGDTSFALTVGFKPSQVVFSSDGSSAFVVTDDGISVVRFASITGPARAPLVPLGAVGSSLRDVAITPEGRHAVARPAGGTTVGLTDLQARTNAVLDLDGEVTDLDLAPDGSFVLATVGGRSRAVRIAVPGGFSDPAQRAEIDLTGEAVGLATLTPDGTRAVLYTTAQPVERLVVATLDGSAPPRAVALRKTVRSVTIAPDGASAVVVHRKKEGSPDAPGLDVEERIDRSFGYSVVGLADGFAKLQLTLADPGAMAITPDSDKVFVLLRDDHQGLKLAQRVDLDSFLVDDFPLGSPPVTVAALAGSGQVFVSQEHPAGRITFIDWVRGSLASVTGFEINGRIIQ